MAAPTELFLAALAAGSRVCYTGNTANRQPQIIYCYLLQSTANPAEKLIHFTWDLKSWFTSPGTWTPPTSGMQAHLSDRSAKSHPLASP
jgi:hypothetical protein